MPGGIFIQLFLNGGGKDAKKAGFLPMVFDELGVFILKRLE